MLCGKGLQSAEGFPKLTIKLALEVDYFPARKVDSRIGRTASWDYFIGSVHYVSDSWAIDNPNKLSNGKSRDAYEVWSVYFDWLTRAADSGLFEIIGHADLPKKFGIILNAVTTSLFDPSCKPPPKM